MTITTDPEGDGNVVLDSDATVTSHIGDKVVINELDLITVKGVKVNLISIFNGITLYESVSSSAISGSIVIRDFQSESIVEIKLGLIIFIFDLFKFFLNSYSKSDSLVLALSLNVL